MYSKHWHKNETSKYIILSIMSLRSNEAENHTILYIYEAYQNQQKVKNYEWKIHH